MSKGVTRCPSCGQLNQVPEVGAGRKTICGRCKAPLQSNDGGHPLEFTDANFEAAVGDGLATVVDFWAAWCGPCRMIGPIIEQLASARHDVRFAKLNVDENPRTASAFHVQGIPLLVFFKGGLERGRLVGAVPRPQIEAAIRQYLS